MNLAGPLLDKTSYCGQVLVPACDPTRDSENRLQFSERPL